MNYGGIQRDVAQIALGIDRSRFEPHVASYETKGIRIEELIRAGVPYFHVPFTSFKSPSTISAVMRVRKYIRENNIQLVHSYDSSAAFITPIARALRVPAVLSSMLGSRELVDARTLRLFRWTDKIVDAVVVNCEAMRRQMVDDEHVPAERIELCYNGVDTSVFCPEATANPTQRGDTSFVIGAVCVLRPEKNLDLLLEAFARIRHLKPAMKLRIVGSGSELPKLEAISHSLGIQEDCEFVPATTSVPQFLRDFDVYVSCSRSEAFSNTILEAMACGCSVVASRVGGTPELTGENERGLLFQPGDVGDLAAKLTRLIESEPFRRSFGTRAAEFVRESLGIEVASKRMAEIYETVLRRKTA